MNSEFGRAFLIPNSEFQTLAAALAPAAAAATAAIAAATALALSLAGAVLPRPLA